MTCPLCKHPNISFYDLKAMYCGKDEQLESDICDPHKEPYGIMALRFSYGMDAFDKIKELKIEGAFFPSQGDDGFGIFVSHNKEEAEKIIT